MTNSSITLDKLMLKLRAQLDSVLAELAQNRQASHNLSALILIMCEHLVPLSSHSKSTLLALALRPDKKVSPLAHHMFCCAMVVLKFGEQHRYHSHLVKELLGAALTMRIGLDLNSQQLSQVIFQRKKLDKEQQRHYYAYPLHSANYLNKASIVDKNSIYAVLQHQELLNGKGYPKGLKAHQINANGKLLALINKFIELTTPRAQRSAFSLAQAFSYLARRSELYCATTLNQLIACFEQPSPGFAITLPNRGVGLIESSEHDEHIVKVIPYHLVDDKLVQSGELQSVDVESITQLIICPMAISDAVLFGAIASVPVTMQPDHCNSSGRLKPPQSVIKLFDALDTPHLDNKLIAQRIASNPALGNALVRHLTKQHPQRQFNDSFHALKMAGFSQSRPLLAILALRAQLSEYHFGTLATLNIKVDSVLALCAKISDFTPHVLPNQLAMFSMLNVAPLYFNLNVQHTLLPERVVLTGLNPLDAASLFGLTASKKHGQLLNTLARFWESSNNTKRLLALECDLSKTDNRYHHELMMGYQLALLITHHIFHQISLDDPALKSYLNNIARKLKMSSKDLTSLVNYALEQAPQCELAPS